MLRIPTSLILLLLCVGRAGAEGPAYNAELVGLTENRIKLLDPSKTGKDKTIRAWDDILEGLSPADIAEIATRYNVPARFLQAPPPAGEKTESNPTPSGAGPVPLPASESGVGTPGVRAAPGRGAARPRGSQSGVGPRGTSPGAASGGDDVAAAGASGRSSASGMHGKSMEEAAGAISNLKGKADNVFGPPRVVEDFPGENKGGRNGKSQKENPAKEGSANRGNPYTTSDRPQAGATIPASQNPVGVGADVRRSRTRSSVGKAPTSSTSRTEPGRTSSGDVSSGGGSLSSSMADDAAYRNFRNKEKGSGVGNAGDGKPVEDEKSLAAEAKEMREEAGELELTAEDLEELAEIIDLLNDAADRNELDYPALSASTTRSRNRVRGNKRLEDIIDAVKNQVAYLKEKSGSTLIPEERESVIAFARKLGLSPVAAERLVLAVERGEPPVPQAGAADKSWWEQFMDWVRQTRRRFQDGVFR